MGAVEPACRSHFVSPMVTVGAPASRSTSEPRLVRELAAGHRLVHHSPRRRIGARDRLAEHQHLPGPGLADAPGQQPRGARVGREATLRVGLPQARRLLDDGEVRRQDEVQPDPGRPPPHLADDGSLRRDQQLNQPVRFGGQASLDAPDPGPRVAGVARRRCRSRRRSARQPPQAAPPGPIRRVPPRTVRRSSTARSGSVRALRLAGRSISSSSTGPTCSTRSPSIER